MSKNKTVITSENLLEWMHSAGYFLPTNELELNRFEKLHPNNDVSEYVDKIDPFAIIRGAWKPTVLQPTENEEFDEEIEIRLAARKQEGLPDHILKKIMNNQRKNDEADNSKE